MLEARNVVKTFDGFRALDNANLTVPKGAVYGLVGPNGAGKSTIIRHFTGVYRPDSGELTLEGRSIYENPAIKQRLCVIPDDWFYFSQWSIREMARLYKGMYPSFSQERYDRMHEVFPLDDRQMIRRMSKGMQKQAAFWITMSCMPEYLILDEPVDGLDPVMRRQVWSLLLGDVAERGTTVLVSSHNLRELEDVCDHVGIMNHGKMLLEKSLADMQGSTVKLQIVGDAPAGFEILHESRSGRLNTYILRGDCESVRARAELLDTAYFDVIPLSLEEIFIYELGGVNDEIQTILL